MTNSTTPPRAEYIVRGRDGREHTVTLSELRGWARDGSVSADHEVYSPVTGKWTLARHVVELRDVLFVSAVEAETNWNKSASTWGIVAACAIAVVLLIFLTSRGERPRRRTVGESGDQASSVDDAVRSRKQAAREAQMLADAVSRLRATVERGEESAIATACADAERLGRSSIPASIPKDLAKPCRSAHLARAQQNLRTGNTTAAREEILASKLFGPPYDKDNEIERQILAVETKTQDKIYAENRAQAASAAKQQAANEIEGRQLYGEMLRDRFLDKGLDIKVTVSGSKADRITLKYVLFNDVWSHRMQKDGLLAELRNLGFKRVTLTDTYDYTIYWDFTK